MDWKKSGGIILAASTIISGIFLTGFWIGKGQGESIITFLEKRIEVLEIDYRKAMDENERLKIEFAFLNKEEKLNPDLKFDSINEDESHINNDEIPIINDKQVIEYTVKEGDSFQIEGTDIVVSLRAIDYKGDPLRHKGWFAIGSKNDELLIFEDEDIGSNVTYLDYNIRLISLDTFYAGFQVERIN